MTDILDEIVTEPHKYDEFLHSNGVPYAYLEVPVALLDETIPEGANWSAKGTEDEPEQKTLGEYTLNKHVSLDGTKVIIALAAMQAETYRTPALTYDDLQDWETWFDTKGYTIDSWLTIAERATLFASEVYNNDSE
jgi:hypothetical protein